MHAFGRETKCMFFVLTANYFFRIHYIQKIVAKEVRVAAYPFCHKNEVPNF